MDQIDQENAMILASLDKDRTIGIGYLGVIVSSIVYGITCVQTFHYYRSPRATSDSVSLRIMVLVLWILDSVQESFAIHVFYFYLIDNYSNASGLLVEVWSLPAGVLANAFISFVVKMFFAMRVWRLSRHNIYVTSVCVVINSTRFVMNLYFPIRMFSFKGVYEAEAKLKNFGAAGLALAAAADVVVSAALVFYLMTSRTGVRRSDNMLSRLIVLTVTTGMLSTCVAIANLVSYVAAPSDLIVLFFTFLIAKVDANALLTSLNSRDLMRDGRNKPTPTGDISIDAEGGIPLSFRRVPAEGISVTDPSLASYGIKVLKMDSDGSRTV